MFIINLLVCLFMQLTVAKADSSSVLPIIHYGTKARIEDYPFFAATEVCGASILSPRWLLTAAHCVHNRESIANQLVFVGGDRVDNSIRLKYDLIVIHPQYKKLPISYDIALLRMQTALRFSRTVRPVRLPTRGTSSNSRLVFVGRGRDETNRPSISLMKMSVVQLSTQDCMTSARTHPEYHNFFRDQTLMCGRKADGKPGVCDGDSGSPLLQGDTIVGLASFLFGKECNRVNIGYYTNVTTFVPWIKSVTLINT